MSVANLFKSLFLGRVSERKWGNVIEVDGVRRDPGVNDFAEEITNALRTGGTTDIYEPIKLRQHFQGPMFQVEDAGGNGQFVQYGRRSEEGFNSVTIGLGIESDGLTANNLVGLPWHKLSREDLQAAWDRGRPLWFTEPGGAGDTNVGVGGTGVVGDRARVTGGFEPDLMEFAKLMMQILEKFIGGCCELGEGAGDSTCVQQIAESGQAAIQDFSSASAQMLIHKTQADGGCIAWQDVQTLCELLPSVSGYDAMKTQVLGHVNGTCQMIDVGDCV